MIWVHEIFELLSQRQPSFPKKYTLNNEENQLGKFPGNFLILLEQRFCRTLASSCLREFAIYLLLR